MTPCDIPSPTCSEAGWKVGDIFKVRTGVWGLCEVGEIVQLIYDDDSISPYFFSRSDNTIKSLFTDYVERRCEEKPLRCSVRFDKLHSPTNQRGVPMYNPRYVKCMIGDAVNGLTKGNVYETIDSSDPHGWFAFVENDFGYPRYLDIDGPSYKWVEKPTSEFSGVVWEGMRFQAACPEEYLEISEAINKLEVFRLDA